MAASTPSTILLSTNEEGITERPVREAVVHTAAVTPGDLLLKSASGVTPNTNAADADAQILFAVELAYQNPMIVATASIDTDYAIAAVARYIRPQAGDIVYGWLETGANVAEGAALEASNVAGCVQAYTSGRIVAHAAEAKDNSGGGAPVRIRLEIAQ